MNGRERMRGTAQERKCTGKENQGEKEREPGKGRGEKTTTTAEEVKGWGRWDEKESAIQCYSIEEE